MRRTALGSTLCGLRACSAGHERGGSPVGYSVTPLPSIRWFLSRSVAAAVVAKETPIRGQSRTGRVTLHWSTSHAAQLALPLFGLAP